MTPRLSRLVLVLVAAASISLAGCTPAEAPRADDPAAEPAEPAATPTPMPSENPVVLPDDCLDIVAPQVYDAIFQGTPLNDPAVVEANEVGALTPGPPDASATPDQAVEDATQLRCVWRDPAADVTFLQAEFATVQPTVAEAYLSALPGLGYTCGETLGGLRCQIVGTSPLYPVEEGTTVFVRDDVVITVEQANFPTTNLLAEIVGGIWPN